MDEAFEPAAAGTERAGLFEASGCVPDVFVLWWGGCPVRVDSVLLGAGGGRKVGRKVRCFRPSLEAFLSLCLVQGFPCVVLLVKTQYSRLGLRLHRS